MSWPARLRSVIPAFLALSAWLGLAETAGAWGPMHSRITEAAYAALPPWQQELWAAQRQRFIEYDCIIPDLMRSAAQRKVLGKFITLPDGNDFTHEPHSHAHNLALMEHYFGQAVAQIQAGDVDDAARWAGCLLHFLQDCGSPAHSMPGDNQHGLMQDLLAVPPAFKDRPLHSLIENGTLTIDLAGYHPRLLGTTTPEAVRHLLERLYAEIRNARAQVIPILQGVFANDPAQIDAARMRAARMDAEVSADAIYTLLCIAKGQFVPEEVAPLERVSLSEFTAQQVVAQAYFPQASYFSNPYFGFPVRNAAMEKGETRVPLVLQLPSGQEKTLATGLSMGTTTRLTYLLPARVYERFECLIGLHALLGKQGKINVHVWVDGVPVFENRLILGTEPARPLSVPIYRGRELSITIESAGQVPAGSNYVVLGEPVLIKAGKAVAEDPHSVQ